MVYAGEEHIKIFKQQRAKEKKRKEKKRKSSCIKE
jgi:hypothetical protein